MPNGGSEYTDAQWQSVLSFFSSNEQEIIAFSSKYNLFIDKYYHGSSSWDLRFIHPKGGEASINICFNVSDNIPNISGSWHIDIYDEFTRYIKWGKKRVLNLIIEKLTSSLFDQLIEMINWDRSDMIAYSGYEYPWKNYTKNEFEEMVDKRVKKLNNLEELNKNFKKE